MSNFPHEERLFNILEPLIWNVSSWVSSMFYAESGSPYIFSRSMLSIISHQMFLIYGFADLLSIYPIYSTDKFTDCILNAFIRYPIQTDESFLMHGQTHRLLHPKTTNGVERAIEMTDLTRRSQTFIVSLK